MKDLNKIADKDSPAWHRRKNLKANWSNPNNTSLTKDLNKVANNHYLDEKFEEEHLDSLRYDTHWININNDNPTKIRKTAHNENMFGAPKWSNPNK